MFSKLVTNFFSIRTFRIMELWKFIVSPEIYSTPKIILILLFNAPLKTLQLLYKTFFKKNVYFTAVELLGHTVYRIL